MLLVAFCFLLFSTQAKVWRVNSTGADADFTGIQAAHDAAQAGDTLHLEPAGNSYGALTISKEIVILGNGYFLGANVGLQANQLSSRLSTVTIQGTADGTFLKGLLITTSMSIQNNADNVSVIRCYVQNVSVSGSDNVLFSGCYLFANGNVQESINIVNGSTSFLVTNCVLDGDALTNNTYAFEGDGTINGVIKNCVLEGRLSVNGVTIENSIHRTGNVGNLSATNANLRNNLSVSSAFGTQNGNQANVDMNTVFVNSGSSDARLILAAGSPAIGAGLAGEDAGIFGGVTPYQLSGIPDIPSIYKLEAPSGGAGNIQVTISTRSNN